MKKIINLIKGFGASVDKQVEAEITEQAALVFDGNGDPRTMSPWGFFTTFGLLPAAAVAAGTEKYLVSIGTGTEVIARAAKGGVNVKTQATTPADNDNAILTGIASTASQMPIRVASRIIFRTRVNLSQITQIVFGAGLDENLSSPIGLATAGDGAQFLFDPADENGLVAANPTTLVAANFILAMKVNGTDTYKDSGIAVVAGRDYELEIRVGEDLKPNYYVDGVLVGTGASALTDGDSIAAVIGIQINAASPSGQKDFDCRYVSMERRIG